MAGLVPLTLPQAQQLLATQYASTANQPARTDKGSALGAIFNATALLALQLQQQILYTNNKARMATSQGADIDSFWAPFGIPRLGSAPATGQVTFATSSPVSGSPIVVPVGVVVQTASGVLFTVIADTTNDAYSPTLNGYPIEVGYSTVNASVQCNTNGTVGNVLAGAIAQIYTGIPVLGISTVSNASAFTTGQDTELDAPYQARGTTIASGNRSGTGNAIIGAALSVRPGLTVAYGDRLTPSNTAQPSYFSVIVNEAGSGTTPPSPLVSACAAAVAAVAPAGIDYAVSAPSLVNVNASAVFTIAPGYVAATVLAAAVAAYEAFVNGIGLSPAGGSTLCSYGQVYAKLFAVPGVQNVDSLLLNSATSDVSAVYGEQLVAGTTSFTT